MQYYNRISGFWPYLRLLADWGVRLKQLNMVPSNTDPRRRLLTHPASICNLGRGTLPEPANDPHPALTVALYELWDVLRPLVHFNTNDQPVLAFGGPVTTAHHILLLVAPAFVSFLIFSLFLAPQTKPNSCRNTTSWHWPLPGSRNPKSAIASVYGSSLSSPEYRLTWPRRYYNTT